jgi:hypothetical protein
MRAPAFLAATVAVALVSALLVGSAVVSLLDAFAVPERPTRLAAVEHIEQGVLLNRLLPATDRVVVLFGDSMSMGAREGRIAGSGLDAHLRGRFATRPAGEPTIGLDAVVYSGLSPFSYWFLLDEALPPDADLAVLELNLFHLAPDWLARDRIHLAAFVEPSRWLRTLALPLSAIGLSADRLFFFGAMFRAGLIEPWAWLQRRQARLAYAYWGMAEALDPTGGMRFHRRAALERMGTAGAWEKRRMSPREAEALLGTAVGGIDRAHPTLVVLEALLEELARRDVATLVWIPPHNLDRLRELGMLNEEGLASSISVIGERVVAAGARFVDLHALLPDAYFRDQLDHLSGLGEDPGLAHVADVLAPSIVEALGAGGGR